VKGRRVKLLSVVLVVLAMAAAAQWLPWRWLQDRMLFVQWVESIKGSPWAAPIFVGAYVVCCLIAPVTPFSIAGGVLFGVWKGFFLNMLSMTLGATIAFEIARILGRNVVHKLLRGKAKAMDEGLKRHGFLGILIVRVVGIPPFIAANYMAGLSEIGLRDYVLATVLGSIHWTIFITYFSNILWRKFILLGITGVQQTIGRHARPLGFFVIAFLALAAAIVILKKRRPRVFLS
jgi:uncharacterized membrane protein YdjX (TVP38/TMEM64 family)